MIPQSLDSLLGRKETAAALTELRIQGLGRNAHDKGKSRRGTALPAFRSACALSLGRFS